MISDVTFVACTANRGGALFSTLRHDVTLVNVTARDCRSFEDGGAVHLRADDGGGAAAVVIDSRFVRNTAASEGVFHALNPRPGGGAVFVASDGGLTVTGSTFEFNRGMASLVQSVRDRRRG